MKVNLAALAKFQKQYTKLYNHGEGGFCGINDRQVHLDAEAFVELLGGYRATATNVGRQHDYPLQLAFAYDQVEFMAIFGFDEILQYSLADYLLDDTLRNAYMEWFNAPRPKEPLTHHE